MARDSGRRQKVQPQPKQQEKVTWVKHSNRGRAILLIAISIIAVILAVYAFHGGSSSSSGTPTNTQAPYTVTTNPSTLQFTGPGIIAFDVNISSSTGYSNQVSLSLGGNTPTGYFALFTPSVVNPASPVTVHVILIVTQLGRPESFPLDIVATSSPYSVDASVNVKMSYPTSVQNFALIGNQTGFNATSTSGPNPTIRVHKGEPFQITLSLIPNSTDIHHYISIYPSGTDPSAVNEQGVGSYAHSPLAHIYPATSYIIFTSYLVGSLDYYCDAHPDSMHGTINVIP